MNPKNTLTAIYDLQTSPHHFDFVTFMAIGDALRVDKNCSSMDVIIVPDQGSALQSHDHRHKDQFSSDHANWRLNNIFLPTIGLVRSCGGFTICHSREQARAMLSTLGGPLYPEGYDIDDPPIEYWTDFEATLLANIGLEFPGFHASKQALDYVDQWLAKRANGRKTISITLREGSHGSSKNSDVGEWSKFAKSLNQNEYFIVFLPDIERALEVEREDLEGFTVFSTAIFNLLIRMAFYERCYLSLFTSCGPISLCYYNGATRFINFKSVPPTSYSDAVPFVIMCGLDVGDDQPWSTPYQRKIEKPEEFNLVTHEFNKMVSLIEANKDEAFQRLPLKQRNLGIENLARVSKFLTKNSNSSRSVMICQKYLERFPTEEAKIIEIMVDADLNTSHAETKILKNSQAIYQAIKNPSPADEKLKWAATKVGASLGDEESFARIVDLATQKIKISEVNSEIKTLPLKLAVFFVRQERFEEALGIVEVADAAQRTQDTLFMLGMICQAVGRLESARDAFLELEKSGNNDPRIFESLANIYKGLGDPGAAARYFQISMGLPTN